MHPCLVKILKIGMWSWESLESLHFLFRLKCSGGSRQNASIPPPNITNVSNLMTVSLSFHFTLTLVVKFTPLSEPETRRLIKFPVNFQTSFTSISVYNARIGSETDRNAKSRNNQRISRTPKWCKLSLYQVHAWHRLQCLYGLWHPDDFGQVTKFEWFVLGIS